MAGKKGTRRKDLMVEALKGMTVAQRVAFMLELILVRKKRSDTGFISGSMADRAAQQRTRRNQNKQPSKKRGRKKKG